MTRQPQADNAAARARPVPVRRAGFSFVEMVIVVVIVGLLGALAVLRIGSLITTSRKSALAGDLQVLQKAVEMYIAEHNGLGPADNDDGSTETDWEVVVARLVRMTREDGGRSHTSSLGPYIKEWPTNPWNGRQLLRLDGPPAGADLAGWRYDTLTRIIEADNGPGSVIAPDMAVSSIRAAIAADVEDGK
jgi:prepilin-type N-terminal cleavage/methylation domain-containing protein